jgi:hypothetical protein
VSGMPEGNLKARDSQGSTGVLWTPGYMALPKSGKTLTRMPATPRSNGSTLVKEVNPL